MWLRPSVFWILLPAAVASAACTSNNEVLKKHLDRMERDVVQLRAANLALQDRLEALEQVPTAQPQMNDRPTLDVVRLTPSDDAAAPLLEAERVDDAPRPLLRAEGDEARIEEPSAEHDATINPAAGGTPAVRGAKQRGANPNGSQRKRK